MAVVRAMAAMWPMRVMAWVHEARGTVPDGAFDNRADQARPPLQRAGRQADNASKDVYQPGLIVGGHGTTWAWVHRLTSAADGTPVLAHGRRH